MNTTKMRIPSNSVRDIEHYFHKELDCLYGIDEVNMFIRMLFEAFLGWDLATLLINRNKTVNQSDLLRFHWAVQDLIAQRPIQHIIGEVDFCGCRIKVTPDALIPRPETEEIVQKIIERHRGKVPKRILDLCTGSGCIAIALAKAFPSSTIVAIDYSDKALSLAKQNAEANDITILFQEQNLLEETDEGNEKYDIIVSNPPYIPSSERSHLDPNVVNHEPSTALFVPDHDPLLFYRAIGMRAKRQLDNDGSLIVEIHEKFGQETCTLLESMGYKTILEKDFRGKERMITAKVSQK